VVQFFTITSQFLIRAMGGKTSPRQMFVTRDELKLLAHEGSQGVSLTGEQRNLVASILDSPHATAREVMRSRTEVAVVQPSQSEDERLSVAAQRQFSRLPIEIPEAEGGIRWEKVWVAYDALFQTGVQSRPCPSIPIDAHLEEILAALRKARTSLGVVRDHEGKAAGIVTVEDVLRRYLGKIEL
jgi:putative hemolysin